jgi:signal transduction histidine kinase/CHASE3 domain sensor protein
MKTRRGLTARIVVAGVLLAGCVGTTFALLLLAISHQREAAQSARSAYNELIAAVALEGVILDLETGVRGYVITGDPRFLQPWNNAREQFGPQAKALEALTRDHPKELRYVRAIVQGVDSYIQDYAVPLLDAVGRHDATAQSIERTNEGKERIDRLRMEFDSLRAVQQARITDSQQDADAASRRAIIGGFTGLAVTLLLVVLFTGYLTRVIVVPVRRVAGMAGRLAGGDLKARLPETSVGEVGDLERAFNTMGGSLELSRDALARLVGEQAALRRVATLVARGMPPVGVFSAVADEVGRLLGAESASVARFEPDGSSFVVVGRLEDDSAMLSIGSRVEPRDYLAPAIVWRTGEAALVDEQAWSNKDDPSAERLRGFGIRAMAASPIAVEGRLWGVVLVMTKRGPFPPDTADRISDFTELVATAIGNAESRAELAASRARMVAATDETRRRIERDLHDGTQQRLVSLGLELRQAQSMVPAWMPEVEAEIGDIADDLNGVVDDLREIARGIHPAILSEGGLGPALRTLARRAAIDVEIQVAAIGRLPEPIEVAAYYVVSEALTNATRHADASVLRVTVDKRDDRLQLTIRDDGVGGADPSRGSGLIGLHDRVDALGGSFTVTSPVGEGTLILVQLPLQVR